MVQSYHLLLSVVDRGLFLSSTQTEQPGCVPGLWINRSNSSAPSPWTPHPRTGTPMQKLIQCILKILE